MAAGFVASMILIGLVAVAIPPLIHLLNRRRFDVVDWGAMQFLKVSEKTRRRLLLEEILLMLLRIALLALLVFGIANPWVEGLNFEVRLPGARPARDVVLVFDGAYSMDCTDGAHTAHDAAKQWALDYLDACAAGDKVAVLQAKQQVVSVVGALESDLQRVRDRLDRLPAPAGGCDWPQAVHAAEAILADSTASRREIIVLSDGQRYGWADDTTMVRWNFLKEQLGIREGEDAAVAARRPHITVLNVDPQRKPDVPNWSLEPIATNRVVAAVNRELLFRSAIVVHGLTDYTPDCRLRLEVDGQFVRNLTAPQVSKAEKGKVPFSFFHKFGAAGSHLLSVLLEPDPPPDKRGAGYKLKDYLPGDNRQDLAIEVVPSLPVLLVDGDPSPMPVERRGAEFLRTALTPIKTGDDRALLNVSPILAEVVGVQQFDPVKLNADATRPRVLILCNVARLTPEQQEGITRFLSDGGGVLVTLGDRSEAEFYNKDLYHNGDGWLPAKLDAPEGDNVKKDTVVRPARTSFTHPALEVFKEMPEGRGLDGVDFPRWWKLAPPGRNTAAVEVASLRSATKDFPFLVERMFHGGRVLLCSVPLDNSWATDLTSKAAFVPLAHELVYYLAGARSSEFNLQAGQPLRYRVATDAPTDGFTLEPPGVEARPLREGEPSADAYPAQLVRQPRGASLVYAATRETGVYKLQTPDNATVYYVVQPDARESDLAPATAADRKRVSDLVPMTYVADPADAVAATQRASGPPRQEFWWVLLIGVIVLLCSEVWMTRRMVKNR